jgi:hypothetical protein
MGAAVMDDGRERLARSWDDHRRDVEAELKRLTARVDALTQTGALERKVIEAAKAYHISLMDAEPGQLVPYPIWIAFRTAVEALLAAEEE